MESPNPALGGLTPAEKVKAPEGMTEVVAILEPMASARVSAITNDCTRRE